jgi:hypothetical protein
MRRGMGEHQILHRELGVHHAAGAVLDVEQAGLHRPGGAHLVAHRLHRLRQRCVVARCGQHVAAHRLEALGQRRGPAQQRARVRAWCSQVHAVLLPRPRWYCSNEAIDVTSRPELPFGRSAVSMSNNSPAAVRSVSQVISLRTKAP